MTDDEIPGWPLRALHSYFVTALIMEDEETVGKPIVERLGGRGPTFAVFLAAVIEATFLRIQGGRSDTGVLQYRVEVLTDHNGWCVLTRANAIDIGIDPEKAGPIEDQLWEERARRELGLSE